MISLLLLVVILSVITHLINTVGAQTLNELLWSLYTRLPTKTAKDVQTQKAFQRDVMKLRMELRSTSSQDEFAKWAKTKRTCDKKLQDLEKLKSSISSARIGFESKARFVRWVLTTGLRFFLQYWYAREAMFWIPEGWVPSYVEWGLSFPKAPIGSVSIQVWSYAVGQVVRVVVDLVLEIFSCIGQHIAARRAIPVPAEKQKERKKMK
ncbi:GET complex subunit get1 [Rhizina undulata]